MTLAYIALGSNLGDHRQNLTEALRLLQLVSGIQRVRVSSFHETEPVGGPPGQGKYLNAAAELDTSLGIEELFAALQQIEQQLGRVRSVPNAPRTLDLDLLLYGDLVHQSEPLTVPHPRLHLRPFVLRPLLELAPTAVHPAFGKSVEELAASLLASVVPAKVLAGKSALVTGSTRGIGLAIAQAFARAGADVTLHGRQPAESMQEFIVEWSQAHQIRVSYVWADLRDARHVENVLRAATIGRGADVLVNNAGADVLTEPAASWPFDRKLQELLDVDLKATMELSRAIGQKMKSAGHGVILNMGWDQAETGMEGDSGQLFAAVKGAVMSFTKSLAKTLAPEVRVNCLAPGWIRTAWAQSASAAWQERAVNESLLRRWGTPEDVANTAVWLASDQAAFVNGQTIHINGGAALRSLTPDP
jgi:2-amino-4-hydroxy-6-hydroxymethyldihydropteridine diphosphokinase